MVPWAGGKDSHFIFRKKQMDYRNGNALIKNKCITVKMAYDCLRAAGYEKEYALGILSGHGYIVTNDQSIHITVLGLIFKKLGH